MDTMTLTHIYFDFSSTTLIDAHEFLISLQSSNPVGFHSFRRSSTRVANKLSTTYFPTAFLTIIGSSFGDLL